MSKLISDLDDKTAQGIVDAADAGVIEDNDRNGPVIKEARQKVKEGKGGWTYDVGVNRVWRPSE